MPVKFYLKPFCLAFGLVLGCGGNVYKPVTLTPPTPGAYPDLTGNWEFDTQPGAGAGTPATFYKIAGALSGNTSNGSVTGVLQFASSIPNTCTTALGAIPSTGMVDSASNLSLFSSLPSGKLSLYGSFNKSLSEVFGVANVAGGTCSLAQTNVQGYMLASLTGTWIGTFQNTAYPLGGAPTSTVTTVMIQGNSPSADGTFPLSGTVSSTGACTGSFTFAAGSVLGGSFNSQVTSGSSLSPNYFAGNVPRKGFTTIPLSAVSFSACSSSTYSGALTLQ